MAYARHLMPQIGRLEEGLWYATAFGGHGLNTTAIGGQLVAEGRRAGVDARLRHVQSGHVDSERRRGEGSLGDRRG